MSSNKKTNWGIIGCGKIANKFAEDLRTVSGAELYAVASRSEDKAEAFRERHSAKRSYGDYSALALDAEVDVVYIATPHAYHYDNSLLCLKNKKAVLCEKPLAMNADQVTKMIATAKEKNTFLMEALWTHFLPHYQYVLELVKQRKLGTIRELHADFGFVASFGPEHRLLDKALGGGSLLDLGIYPIFAAMTLLGMPEHIDATASLAANGIDEECRMHFKYKNNAVAHLHCSLIEETPTELKLICDEGVIVVNRHFHAPTSVTVIDNRGSEETIDFEETTHGYRHEAIHVQQMLAEGETESAIMTVEKSQQLISLLDKVRALIGLEYS